VFFYTPQLKYRLTTDKKKLLEESSVGGEKRFDLFGSWDYANAYGSEKDLTAAWKEQKKEFLGSHEKKWFDHLFASLPYALGQYCLVPAVENFKVRYIDEKRTNRYADYREAKDLFVQGVKYAATDRVEKINKLVQADYDKRKALVRQAIAIWEKALEEADYDRKRARVDAKVARNTYYNLALAYAWIDEYDKAREYLQARREDVGNWDKNLMAGIKDLSAFIDAQEVRYRANTWRELLAEDKTPYEYKPRVTESGVHGNTNNSAKQRGPVPNKSGAKNKTTPAPGKAFAKGSVEVKRP
jgi:tetratricopeptide (TPR) repeat protein